VRHHIVRIVHVNIHRCRAEGDPTHAPLDADVFLRFVVDCGGANGGENF